MNLPLLALVGVGALLVFGGSKDKHAGCIDDHMPADFKKEARKTLKDPDLSAGGLKQLLETADLADQEGYPRFAKCLRDIVNEAQLSAHATSVQKGASFSPTATK